jgi:haloalkane dehalogenase
MTMTRHFVRVGERLVHYRRAGAGPPLLMIHQSPRSSAEYAPLIAAWQDRFTIIAPDTPGFGQSEPLAVPAPEIDDYADALIALLDALGISRVGAYGFHSGAIILIAAARRHPARFSAIAANGYAVWLPEERGVFGDRYVPPFRPSAYGEHLVWAWHRMREQSWFFPWYDVRPGARLPRPQDDPAALQAALMDLLASGDAYRLGYGAVLRAPRDVPPPDAATPPVLLTAADGDPLQPHLARLGPLPAAWTARPAPSRAAADALCLAHLCAHPAPAIPAALPGATDRGFVAVDAAGFAGLIHWTGARDAASFALHGPGRAADAVAGPGRLAIDLPGHGLSDGWPDGAPPDLAGWSAVAIAAARALGLTPARVVGESWSALLAVRVAQGLGAPVAQAEHGVLPAPEAAPAWVDADLPDLTPDRAGSHLLRGWAAVRARHFFWPWFAVGAETAIPFDPAAIAPDRLAAEHLALLRARHGRALLAVLAAADRSALLAEAQAGGVEIRWPLPDWVAMRADVWRPAPSTV